MAIFYSPTYTAPAIHFNTFKKSGWIAASLVQTPIAGIQLVAPVSVTNQILRRLHSAQYVAAVETGQPERLAGSNGLGWDPGLWESVCASNGGAVDAALAALRTGLPSGSLSSGLHHARADHGALFCTFNGLALAADAAIRAGAARVLILDLDAHCGGGTHSLIGKRPDIVHLDISTSALDRYAPDGSNRLIVVSDETRYLPTIKDALDAIGADFDLVIYNAGMDPYDGGDFTPELVHFAADREAVVFAWAKARSIPIAFVLAGGYRDRHEVVAMHRLTVAAAARCNSGAALDGAPRPRTCPAATDPQPCLGDLTDSDFARDLAN